MSEIITKIHASMAGTRYAKQAPCPLISTTVEMNHPLDQAFLTEYFVGVKLGHKIQIEDSIPNQKEEAMGAIKRALQELIFGEFRHLLARANYSLYNRDFDAAKRAVEEIEQRMFYDN